jgi:methyltransferase (TIGR00027 family)
MSAAPVPAPRAASRTALGVALLRAAHQLLDDEPRVLDDPVAPRLVGPEALAPLRADPARFRTPEALARRAHVLARSRWAEDRLRDAAARGVRQCVVLGAGLDTFAYRQPGWAAGLAVVEVDHPASQAAKRERLAAAGIVPPPNVAFAAVDLEAAAAAPDPAAAIAGALAAAGARPDAPTFVSWLGVMMYLSPPAADAVLAAAGAMPPGSELAFTFAPPPPPGVDPADWPSRGHRAATAGEPWRTFFARNALAERLRASGFAEVTFLEPAEADARYFRGRRDGLAAPGDVTTGAARV